MLMMILSSAIQSGMSIIFLKLLAELMQAQIFVDNLLLSFIMVAFIFVSAAFQMHMLNCAMKYYDQIEVMPIYQTCIMIMWITTGMIVFEETQYYSSGQLGVISVSIVACCIGIYFLYAKTKAIKANEREERGRDILAAIDSGNRRLSQLATQESGLLRPRTHGCSQDFEGETNIN